MMTIGPVIEKQQKIVNDCVEKKLVYQSYNQVFGKNQITIPNRFHLQIWMMI
jgi:hypothetical protein